VTGTVDESSFNILIFFMLFVNLITLNPSRIEYLKNSRVRHRNLYFCRMFYPAGLLKETSKKKNPF